MHSVESVLYWSVCVIALASRKNGGSSMYPTHEQMTKTGCIRRMHPVLSSTISLMFFKYPSYALTIAPRNNSSLGSTRRCSRRLCRLGLSHQIDGGLLLGVVKIEAFVSQYNQHIIRFRAIFQQIYALAL